MTIAGSITKSSWSRLAADAKKNAQFPGFRKGQIPPYAKPQMVAFCLEDGNEYFDSYPLFD